MDQNENMQGENFESEDSLAEELVEEPQEESITLEEALTGEKPTEDTQGTGGSAEEQKEPGYVQKRISKAVEKATASLQSELAALRAQMEPLREYQLTAEAQELVRTGKVKDLETAKELVRYRQGNPPQPAQQPEPQQPQNDPVLQTRIDMLQHQADRIRSSGGPDVIAEFKTNEEIRTKIVSGEMDFYDLAEQMKAPGRRKTSSPMRSPNGASGASHSFDFENMSSEQFAQLDKKIQEEGVRITLR